MQNELRPPATITCHEMIAILSYRGSPIHGLIRQWFIELSEHVISIQIYASVLLTLW
jgi:hypothetical protein